MCDIYNREAIIEDCDFEMRKLVPTNKNAFTVVRKDIPVYKKM
jgi:hypothetical protein